MRKPRPRIENMSEGQRTPAEFRAIRERLGLSQAWMSYRLGIDLKTLKNWERGNRWVPSTEAWKLLDSLTDLFEKHLADANAMRAEGPNSKTLTLVYYRTQEQYEESTETELYFGFANSLTREIAQLCRKDDWEIH